MLRAVRLDPPRVVIDTSSLVSYVLTRDEIMSRIVAYWRQGIFTLLSSPDMRAELANVLARLAIQQRAVVPLDQLVRGLEHFSEHVRDGLNLSEVCRAYPKRNQWNPRDGQFLACAVGGRAHYLVSSERSLLVIRHFWGVAIVNPGQFLLALELYGMDGAAMATRFSYDLLVDIQATILLERETAARVMEALTLLGG